MRLSKLFIAAVIAAVFASSAQAAGKTVLVAGANGKTGVQLVKVLQARGYKVRAMVRDRGKAGDLGAAVEVVEADVTNPDTLAVAVSGAAFVVSAIGAGSTTPPNNPENVDYQGVANLADAAKAAAVRHFVLLSSIGSGDASPDTPLNKVFGMVLMWKGKGEDHLRRSGVPYTIVRPGGLVDCEPGRTGLNVAPGDAKVAGRICRGDVALVMVDALTNPAATGKTIALVSDDQLPVGAWKKAWAAISKD